ncbi:hypothetical protein SERLADRAFT_473676, partial [Serpula lacrymans var. lacrymans S7.9]
MDLDVDENSSRRPSLVRDRPARPPLPHGPRVRNRPKHALEISSTSSSLEPTSPHSSTLASPSFSNPFLSPSLTPTHHQEETSSDTTALSLSAPTVTISSHIATTAEIGVQAIPISPSSPVQAPLPPRIASPTIKYVPKPATLAPPPQINFDSVPIPWKGLPLDAAQWTLSQPELQEIVSRAIRLSAQESFIRLLSIESLDEAIVTETERLSALKATTQAQYRFQVHRRTMLLQALNSFVTAPPTDNKDKDGGIGSLSGIITQLSDATATCDRLTVELLRVADQLAQLSKVQDRHWASALSIALRKLNKSYERQVMETRKTKEKVEALEDELEEAWREAENIAQEIDEIEFSDEEDGDIEGDYGLDEDISTDMGEVIGVTARVVAQKATLIPNKPSTQHLQVSDNKSVRSRRSGRGRILVRRDSHHSRVSAAKTRSRAASNASLRLPKAVRGGGPQSPTDVAKEEAPPMPALPDSLQGKSFLDMETKTSADTYEFVRPLRKPA